VFPNGATPDPPEAALPCPVPWPTLPESTEEEMRARRLFLSSVVRAVHSTPSMHVNTFDPWMFSGKVRAECGSRNRDIRV